MLREVAHFMQASDQGLKGNLISKQDLKQVLIKYLKTIDVPQPRSVARLMIEQLRTRNFILCDIGGNYYAFVHRTFLEYFCAWSYIWQLEAQAITIEDIKTKVFGQHWQDESWHEVLRLIAGMILDPKKVGVIIEYLMAQNGEKEEFNNLFLAADCLEEVRNKKSIAQISDSLLEKLKQFAKQVREISEQHSYDSKINKNLSVKVVNAIVSNWLDRAKTLAWLKSCIKFNKFSYVPESAIIVIAREWKKDFDTLPWLKERAQSDGNHGVRLSAVQELARGWHDDPDTLPIIKEKAQFDVAGVRISAVQELAKGWHDDPNTLPIIKKSAQANDYSYVRHTAIQELAKGWHDYPEIFELLFERAVQDPFIRDDYNSLEKNPRQTALEAIIEYYPNHPKTKNLLEDRAQNDSDEQIRKYAKKALEKLTKTSNP